MSTNQKSGCLTAFINRLFPPKKAEPHFPYAKCDHFLSAAELSFYHVLRSTISEQHTLLTKVNLGDVFYVQQPHKNVGARNRIDRKHVDFLICDAKTMEPLLGIELDDSSHQKKKQQEKDALKDAVFAAAKLPLLRIKAARSYVPQDLRKAIEERLKNTPCISAFT